MPLTGQALLDKKAQLGPKASKTDLVRACGYVTTKKDGTERLNFTGFYEALLAAKGETFASTSGGAKRALGYRGTVNKAGQIVIGTSYVTQAGLKPGDTFQLKVSPEMLVAIPAPAEGADSDGGNVTPIGSPAFAGAAA